MYELNMHKENLYIKLLLEQELPPQLVGSSETFSGSGASPSAAYFFVSVTSSAPFGGLSTTKASRSLMASP